MTWISKRWTAMSLKGICWFLSRNEINSKTLDRWAPLVNYMNTRRHYCIWSHTTTAIRFGWANFGQWLKVMRIASAKILWIALYPYYFSKRRHFLLAVSIFFYIGHFHRHSTAFSWEAHCSRSSHGFQAVSAKCKSNAERTWNWRGQFQ